MITKYKESLKSAKSASEKDTYRKSVESTTSTMKNQIENYNREIENIKRNIVSLKEDINRIKSK